MEGRIQEAFKMITANTSFIKSSTALAGVDNAVVLSMALENKQRHSAFQQHHRIENCYPVTVAVITSVSSNA